MLEINLNMYHAVALGAAMFWLGTILTSRIGLLNRFCIPAPLVGGLCFALVNTLLYATGVAVIQFDNTLETVFMVLFFCTVGFTVSIPQLLKGGKAVILLLLLGTVMIVLQNGMGGAIMALMGKNPLYGIGCGSIALIGGPGTAAGIGPDLEAAGAAGAKAVSIAAATFGLVSGSLMGGPTARRLINKFQLSGKGGGDDHGAPEDESLLTNSSRLIKGFMLILLGVGIGNQVSTWLTQLCGFSFPGYIGAMVVAVVVRNVMDAGNMEFPDREIESFGNVFLSIFLSMALAGLKLWQLVDLALPMIVCLAAQVLLMFLFAYFIVFRVMGKDYDAAVMTAGFIGFGMGATSNAMANMQVVSKKYGPSPIAYFAIPMVGSLFIDFFNAAMIAFNIGLWS
jgi:ESS family glutamate:Na+ symporter